MNIANYEYQLLIIKKTWFFLSKKNDTLINDWHLFLAIARQVLANPIVLLYDIKRLLLTDWKQEKMPYVFFHYHVSLGIFERGQNLWKAVKGWPIRASKVLSFTTKCQWILCKQKYNT